MSRRKVEDSMGATAPRFTDANEDLTFKVTNHAIEDGVPGDATSCIFAQGLCQSRSDIAYAEIRPNKARVIFKDGRRLVYQTSRELRLGLRAFDAVGAAIIEPGIYTLETPRGVRRIEYGREAKARYYARVAAGEIRPYAKRQGPNKRVVAEARPIRSSIWGARPTFVTGHPEFQSHIPLREPWQTGQTNGPSKS